MPSRCPSFLWPSSENAGGLIKDLSRRYNRARQSQITGEIMEILGGVEALKK